MESDARQLLVSALVRTAAGERTGLQTTYRLTSAKLFGVCLRILGERAEAEDVLQEVYLTVWRKAADFDPARASPMTWLITIARNRAIDRVRSKAQRKLDPIEAATEVADATPSAQASLEDAQSSAKLHGCLGGLAEREQTALRGAYFDGATYEEMAERMTMPLGTMKSLIRRALMKLKTCLEQ
ncbi:MAG: sigma-70 family RNA polymerase sigma factor [Pseudolabrys sp.]|nr:sigma-70 family RNA polymerase sigma factor [Pseudolabrys sp.]MBV9262001.1 sigma-70 family RNA polymerase sigma factor [Pseudolabrys sp.]